MRQIIRFVLLICAVAGLAELILLSQGMRYESWVFYYSFRTLMSVFSLFFLYLLWREGSRLARIVFLGTLCIILGEVVSLFLVAPISTFAGAVGVFLEIIFLTYGLAYRANLFQKAHFKLQNEHIAQLEENERLLKIAKKEEVEAFKNLFYANITHEFRTPLTVILGMSESLRELTDAQVQKIGKLITRNGQNLLNLVNQLLDLSKMESGKLELHPSRADIMQFVKINAEAFESLAEMKKQNLSVTTEPTELWADFDPDRLQQIIANLVSNAVKFTPEGGRIELKIMAADLQLAEPSKIVLQISDTGSGIPADELDRIFDRFYQVDNSTTRQGEGAGIGLAMVQELIKLMNGTVTVTSTSGVGTSFRITLPYTQPQQQLPALDAIQGQKEKSLLATRLAYLPNDGQLADGADAASSATPPSSLPQLLIIEDNPDVVAYLKTCLEGLYQLEVAYNGKVGIEKALSNIPDLIISDVMMPEKDGYEVCDYLKNDERTSHIPIVLLTAKADSASKIAGLRRGADAYLPKPFDLEELLVRLKMLLERQKRMAAYFAKKTETGPENETPESKEVYDTEDVFISKVRQIIEENMADSDFAMPQLCQILSMSRSQLLRKMKALVDISPSDFIRMHRLQKAKTMLNSSDLTVSEVAYEVGYKDVSHFSRSFREMFGVPPSQNSK